MMNSAAKRKSWLSDILALLTAASGIGYFLTVYGVSRWLTRAPPTIPRLPELNLGCTCQELECRTTDGLRLAGWAITPAQPKATIALFHGLRRDREQILDRVAFLTA